MDDVLVLILILLLLAAVFGILGAVLKAALVIALAIVLAAAVLGAAGYYYFRYRWRKFTRELVSGGDRRRVIDVPNEARGRGNPARLPDPRDPGP
jgi:O-antigen/teichoic acid export membrane protein